MDDLNGLDFSSNNPKFNGAAPAPKPNYSSFPVLSPSRGLPNAGSRPLESSQRPATVLRGQLKSEHSSTDSFSTLLSLNSTKNSDNLSLQEKQQQLLDLKARKAEQERKEFDAHFGAASSNQKPQTHFTPASTSTSDPAADILAAFKSAPPVNSTANRSADSIHPRLVSSTDQLDGKGVPLADDDDPFELNKLDTRKKQGTNQLHQPEPVSSPLSDDDVLGLLAKPVSEIHEANSRQRKQQEDQKLDDADDIHQSAASSSHPQQKAVNSLVDMGFPVDQAAEALSQTESGLDVRAAISILLNRAHQNTSNKNNKASQDHHRNGHSPNDLQWPQSDSVHRPQREGGSAAVSKEVGELASQVGSNLLKSANSIWRSSQKKVQKAVSEFHQDGSSSRQPKWMQDAQSQSGSDNERIARTGRKKPSVEDDDYQRASSSRRHEEQITDEALMLESAPPARTGTIQMDRETASRGSSRSSSLDPRHALRSNSPDISKAAAPRHSSPLSKTLINRPSRWQVEEESAKAYVSPARRKAHLPNTNDNILDTRPSVIPSHRVTKSPEISTKASRPLPPTRPKPTPRTIPPVSQAALSSSASHRSAGSESFKRGDYVAAHVSYTTALSALPPNHPATIMIMCNRALTNIKVGDPKAAIADADAVLKTIGPSKGESESITSSGLEADKPMKEFYGKAMMRKAEALEQMERWAEAAVVWRETVEAGLGGGLSIQGRTRCEKAAKPTGPGKPAKPLNLSPSSRSSSSVTTSARPAHYGRHHQPPSPSPARARAQAQATQASAVAVKKLRAANAAAERADDEKFALTDQVEARLVAWKGTKSDNLRALLGSLDLVLWPESGWKKVGMSDLVMPARVKVSYMKAIAKVHPDKISPAASTEQRMISAAVFSVLNDAWDKFKVDNGL